MAKRRKKVKKGPLVVLVLIILLAGVGYYFYKDFQKKKMLEDRYLGSSDLVVSLYNENNEKVKDISRGTKVSFYINAENNGDMSKIKVDSNDYYVKNDNLVKELKDAVFEKELYVRTSYNLNKDTDGIDLLKLVKKGDKVDISGFDKLNSDGSVNMYKIKYNDEEGYFYNKYLVKTKEDADKNYDYNGSYEFQSKQKNVYGGGDGASLDYYPVDKPKFKDNVMPEKVYSLYLNGTKPTMNMLDDYISFAKTTKINAFVVDIIDDVSVSYASPYMEKNSPTSFKHASNTLDEFKGYIKKLKDNGF